MHPFAWPAWVGIVSSSWSLVEPATRPAAGRPDVSSLIRRLDDPSFSRREEAARALARLGTAVLPELEKTRPGASFEIQIALRQIAQRIHESRRGALVYEVSGQSQASRLGIRPGDVITRLEGQPIPDSKAFALAAPALEKRRRRILVRGGEQEQELTVEPGKIGVALTDYEEQYGPALAAAVRAFHDEYTTEARDRFREAERLGRTFTRPDRVCAMYAISTYLAGDPEGARRLLDQAVARTPLSDPWRSAYFALMPDASRCAHLTLYAGRKHLAGNPDDAHVTLDLPWRLLALNRYPDAIAAAQALIDPQAPAIGDYREASGWSTLLSALHALDLGEEAADVVKRLADSDAASYMWVTPLAVAVEMGRPELVLPISREVALNSRVNGRLDGQHGARVVHIGLINDDLDAVSAFLREIKPSERAAIVAAIPGGRYRWPAAKPILADLARSALRAENVDEATLVNALGLLSWQEGPDPAELSAIMDAYLRRRESSGNRAARPLITEVDRAEVSLLAGDFEAARRLLKAAESAGHTVPDCIRAAAEFLEKRQASLAEGLAPWRRTRYAYELADQRLLLLTRDDRLGLASGGSGPIAEIPPPESRWMTNDGRTSLYLSLDRRMVFTTGARSLYLLKSAGDGWEEIARLPTHLVPRVGAFSLALGSMVPLLRASAVGPAEVVWPLRLDDQQGRLVSLMLADGTWICCDKLTGSTWLPRRLAEQALGRHLDIFEIVPVDEGADIVYLFSTQGLLQWLPDQGRVIPLELPDEKKPLPVARTAEGGVVPVESIRLALLPADGGTTYILDTHTGLVRLEGCISESLPATYWKHMPPLTRRTQAVEAVRRSGHEWPWGPGS